MCIHTHVQVQHMLYVCALSSKWLIGMKRNTTSTSFNQLSLSMFELTLRIVDKLWIALQLS